MTKTIKRKTTKRSFAILLIGIYFLGGLLLYRQNKTLKSEVAQYRQSQMDQQKTDQVAEKENGMDFQHIVDIPTAYFDPDEVFEYGDTNTLKGIEVNLPPVAINIPAEDIQLYNDELDSLKTDEHTGIYRDNQMDVDGDGAKETVSSIEGLAVSHGATEKIITKNRKIIYRTGIIAGNIKPTASGNGFYIYEMIYSGTLFGVGGARTTRYIYENGKFIPVWYQDHFDLQTTMK